MSKYVSEIVTDIGNNPETWVRYNNDGLQKGDVIISGCGNGHWLLMGWATSVAEVTINGKDTWQSLARRDKYRIEEVFLWWMRNASLQMMSKN